VVVTRLRSVWGVLLPLVLLGPVLLVASTARPAVAAPAWNSPRAWTRSFYIANTSTAAMGQLGCYSSETSGRMTLFFGAPTDVGGNFGATLWGAQNRTIAQIGELARNFVRGFVWCRPGGQQALVGLGTSNSAADTKPDAWLAGHGATWASMVRSVAEWAERTYPGTVRIYGAWDVEPSWSAFAKADRWMQGYNGFPGRRPLHVHASADGCPRDAATGGPCNNGWNQYFVWRLAWWYDPSLPLPQVYATSGVNARQWQKLAEYGARSRHDRIVFSGVMTQWGACQQRGGCNLTNNRPEQGHDQLLLNLQSSPLTYQDHLDTVTDIRWHS